MPIYQDNRDCIQRLRWLRVLFVLAVVGLVGRLWYVTVLRYEKYQELAQRNQIRSVPLTAPRGPIFDREGRILVDNTFGFDLILFRDEKPNIVSTLDYLSKGLGLDRERLEERLRQASHYGVYQPVVLKDGLSMDQIAFLAAHQSEHPELGISKQPKRLYRYGELAAHVLGYVGEVSRDELGTEEFGSSKPGDLVGKYGVERTYNRRLTGIDGSQKLLVNSRGKTLTELETDAPKAGNPLELTLDLDLQQAAEEALGESPGAVVAFDPNNGDVLVMASRPAFDPNQFASRISLKEWSELVENPEHPLQNRVIQSNFSPGSIFKVIVALAGLEKGVVDLSTSVYCSGSVTIYNHPFRCWNAGGHGRIALVDAIQHSCNVYFYLLGQKLGIDNLAAFSRRVGLGRPTGIDLAAESSGLVPTPEWKKRKTGQPWFAGETISVAIGQGPVNVTPIQLARAIGIVGTGQVPQLHLAADGFEAGNDAEVDFRPIFSQEHLRAVREGMWRVVNEAGGTGRGARVAGFDVCGKTGTVQTISNETKAKLSREQAGKYVPHAWFVGFAPRDDPRIVVAVLVQRGGSGGGRAAPIAGKIFELFASKLERRGLELADGSREVERRAGGGR